MPEYKKYIGVKIIKACVDNNIHGPGYHVIYEDGFERRIEKDVFDMIYHEITPWEREMLNANNKAG
jgi:hypothetical protein